MVCTVCGTKHQIVPICGCFPGLHQIQIITFQQGTHQVAPAHHLGDEENMLGNTGRMVVEPTKMLISPEVKGDLTDVQR